METEKVIERLKSFGYEYDPIQDENPLEFAISKVIWRVKHLTNCDTIPDGLSFIAIDMVCGEFLKIQKGMGQLSQIQFEQIAQSVREGDTSVTFANESTPEQKFDLAIDRLLEGNIYELISYRKLVW